jgi:phytoene dehydrogenase-like protein
LRFKGNQLWDKLTTPSSSARGHNGLVAAAYLAKQGKKVLVLERRAIVGGSVVTESFAEGGITVDSVHTGGMLPP